jgi:hypothetical protein
LCVCELDVQDHQFRASIFPGWIATTSPALPDSENVRQNVFILQEVLSSGSKADGRAGERTQELGQERAPVRKAHGATQEIGEYSNVVIIKDQIPEKLFPPEIGILIPLAFFEICWWDLAVRWDYFSLFHDRYLLSITMVFGATVAGKLS